MSVSTWWFTGASTTARVRLRTWYVAAHGSCTCGRDASCEARHTSRAAPSPFLAPLPWQCICPDGWEGADCSIPVCKQSVKDITTTWGINTTLLGVNHAGQEVNVQYRECPNRGNCTLPDTCTCEKGWEGEDCTIPICAQECLNGTPAPTHAPTCAMSSVRWHLT